MLILALLALATIASVQALQPVTVVATVFTLAAFVPTVAAAPLVNLVFGWADMAPIFWIGLFAVSLWVFAPFVGLTSWLPIGHVTQEQSDHVRAKLSDSWLFGTIVFYVFSFVKFAGQVGAVVIILGYLLHEFVDAADVDVSTFPMETWFTYIMIFLSAAVRLDLEASQNYRERARPIFSAIISGLEFATWGAVLLFTLLEFFQLDDAVAAPWEIAVMILAGAWLLVSGYFTVFYAMAANVMSNDDYHVLGTKRTEGRDYQM